MPSQTKTERPPPKTILFKYATVGLKFISPMVYSNHAIALMNGKPRLLREKNTIPLLSKPLLVCMFPINMIYAVTCQNTTNIWTTCTWPTLVQVIAHSLGRYTVVMCTMGVSSSSCGSLVYVWGFMAYQPCFSYLMQTVHKSMFPGLFLTSPLS